MNNKSLLFSLPQHLQISVVVLLAKHRATDLGPLIASGKSGMELALCPHVLEVASLCLLALIPSVVNHGSSFRSFIIRCANAGNNTACYLESIRLVAQDGDVEGGLNLLVNREGSDRKSTFALALLLFTAGRLEESAIAMHKFKVLAETFDIAVHVTQRFYWDIDTIGPQNRVFFSTGWQDYLLYPPTRGTSCILCEHGESCCPDYCRWWLAPYWFPILTYPPGRGRRCNFHIVNSACRQCLVWWFNQR